MHCIMRGISKSICHFICHSTILAVTEQFCQDVDFINNFDKILSSKLLWSRICLYLRTADIWICWFCICQTQYSTFADKWYQCLFRSSAGFLPKKLCIFQPICISRQVIHPHLSEFVVFFTAHQSEFICPTHFHSALPTVWWMVTERNIWWWMVMDKGMEHRRISPKKKLYLPTPIIYPINYLAFSLLCAVKCWMAPKKGLLLDHSDGSLPFHRWTNG